MSGGEAMGRGSRARLINVTAMLIFGSVGLFTRGIDLTAAQIALGRSAIGAPFLLLVSLLMKKRPDLRAIRRNGRVLLLSGAAMGFHWMCLFESFRHTTIAVGTLATYLAPVFVILASPLVLRERLTRRKVLCVALALVGMVLAGGALGGGAGPDPVGGVAIGVISAALYATLPLLNMRLRGIPSLDATIAQLTAAALVLLPYTLLRDGLQPVGGTSLALLVGIGTLHTGLGLLLYFSSLRDLPGQTAAVLSYIDPVTAILLSALLLREPISGAQIAGAALIIGALLWSELPARREPQT